MEALKNRAEFHKAAAMLAQEEGSYPSDRALEEGYAALLEQEAARFHAWLDTLPQELQGGAEDAALGYVCASSEEAFERGFRAGIRLIIQAMG